MKNGHSINYIHKEFVPIEKDYNFSEIYNIFKDVVYNSSEENINNILLEYMWNNEKTLFGYFLDRKLVGIIGVKNNIENIEVLHFGIHSEYRGKKLGTELMDFIKSKGKTIILSTDDDAIIFYKKYGFKYNPYYVEYNKIRYNCIYMQ